MTIRLRRLIWIIALLSAACGLLALAYALWPLEIERALVTVAPALFAPP